MGKNNFADQNQNREIIKANVLATLKGQWKEAVRKQYKEEPDKVKNADVTKNAKEIINNTTVKFTLRMGKVNVTLQDVEKILTEIKQEVITENQNQL